MKADEMIIGAFGERVHIHKRSGIFEIMAVLWQPDKRSMIGTLDTGLEDIRAEILPRDALDIREDDRIEHLGSFYTIYDISDDDIDGGLVSLWLRRECNVISN
jgi:hypothetical protein